MRSVVVAVLFIVVSVLALAPAVGAQEVICVQTTAEMKIRTTPEVGDNDTGQRIAQRQVVQVIQVGDWYQLTDGRGFFAVGWANQVSCETAVANPAPPTSAPAQVAQANTANSPFTGWSRFGETNLYYNNLPRYISPAQLEMLIRIIAGRAQTAPDHSRCDGSLFFVAFANQAQMQAWYPGEMPSIAGFRWFGYWDGMTLNPVPLGTSEYCHNVANVIVVLTGRYSADWVWEFLAHEISHVFGTGHGSSSYESVTDVNPNLPPEQDAYWIGAETRAAYQRPRACQSETCRAIADLVFGYDYGY